MFLTRHAQNFLAAMCLVAGLSASAAKDVPTLGKQPIGRVLEVKAGADGLLTLQSFLPDTAQTFPDATNPEVRVNVPTLPGFCLIDLAYPPSDALEKSQPNEPPAAEALPRIPARFRFTHHSYNTPGQIHVLTQVLFIPTHMQMSRDYENLTGSLSISFIQNTNPYDNPEAALEAVRLSVRSSSSFELPNNKPELRIDVAEPTLALLRQRHPTEVALYLRPLLSDLGQAHLLLIDPVTAWQVLGSKGDYTPTQEQNSELELLLKELDDADFSVRSNAAEKLAAMGPQAAAALRLRQPSANWSPEQRTAVEAFLASNAPLSDEEAKTLFSNADFLLDALQLPDPTLRALALPRLTTLFPTAAAKLSELSAATAQLPPPPLTPLTPEQADELRKIITQPTLPPPTSTPPHTP